MKTVVITGSARGFGFALAKEFRAYDYNVVLSDINESSLDLAKYELTKIAGGGQVETCLCDVSKYKDLENLYYFALSKFEKVDIWVNNAGINQPDRPVCYLNEKDIKFLLDIDLKGAIYGSQIAFNEMLKQGGGQIYNVEGYGSNDAMMPGLTIYGTSKRAISYFSHALAKESHKLFEDKVKVCLLTPGIMITNFISSANGGKTHIDLSEKTKKVYNILGDYPETIAKYSVKRMVKNTKNDRKIVWLTGARAFGRFLTAGIKKRNFFD